DGFKFSSEQVGVLIPNQRSGKNKTINLVEDQVNALFTTQKNKQCESIYGKTLNIVIANQLSKGMEEETIGDMAQWILQDKLSIRDVRAEAYTLALSAKNSNAGSSCLTCLRRELRNLNASLEIIEATKFPDITEDANKIQSVNRKKAEAKHIDYPDEFTLESVKERLDAYDIKTLPDCQALVDVMVMLCIRPAELKTLCITDTGVMGYAKNRGKPGVKWFNKFLKDYDLIPKYLHKLGAVYGAVVHKAENPAHVYTIAGECLHHNPDNHTSPVQNLCCIKSLSSLNDSESNPDEDSDAILLKINFFLLALHGVQFL
ncbi:12416_t:CDS:2, partial [Entrophospora sp. SA101]